MIHHETKTPPDSSLQCLWYSCACLGAKDIVRLAGGSNLRIVTCRVAGQPVKYISIFCPTQIGCWLNKSSLSLSLSFFFAGHCEDGGAQNSEPMAAGSLSKVYIQLYTHILYYQICNHWQTPAPNLGERYSKESRIETRTCANLRKNCVKMQCISKAI